MYTKRYYSFKMTFNWSKKPFIYGLIYSFFIFSLYYYFNIKISIPFQPLTIIGIAVAFYLGFKNNSSYDRTWEARKIWGAIVNNSRSFTTALIMIVNDLDIQKKIIYRHIAWLTALRYQLRLSKEWEHKRELLNNYIPEVSESNYKNLESELEKYISREEVNNLKNKSNIATQILLNQTLEIKNLSLEKQISEFEKIRLHEFISFFYDEQGKSERIKNFPFPRQYASTALWLTFLISALVPFGMLGVFPEKDNTLYLSVPISALVIWVFFLMEKIGDYSENPFEGSYNDIPITSISRTIEIDIREMINDTNIPASIKDYNGFLS